MDVSNLERWSEAEGLYAIDSSLEATDGCASSRPIYRQVGGTGFIWANNYDEYWHRTTAVCDMADETKEFFTSNNQFSISEYDSAPITVPSEVESWQIMYHSRSGPTTSSLTVTDALAGSCGE